MPDVRIHHGDCRDVLARLAADGVQVDAIVTDPPYHLTSIVKRFGKAGSAPARRGKTGAFARASKGFMGKQWDGGDVAFQPETWTAVAKVLKPGGHLLAFGGTRTFHRLAVAIEDAGFEIRDTIAWLYGSGFPKSHDVSKGIDKRKDWKALEHFQSLVRRARKKLRLSQSAAARLAGIIGPSESLGGGGFMWFETGQRLPTPDQYTALKLALRLGDSCDSAFEAATREVVGQHAEGSSPGGFGDHRFGFDSRDITAPATDAAKQWEGWGTALKPALEPIVLARKPLSEKSVAANVLKHGTAAINIDGCRITVGDQAYARNCSGDRGHADNRSREMDFGMGCGSANADGRWPANVVHDGGEEVLAAFAAYGDHVGNGHKPRSAGHRNGGSSTNLAMSHGETTNYADTGTAARFFYSAKADASDRLGSKHPTVKPVDLMRWLVRLVTPPGGTVLDPFAGTGTTGMACLAEGFDAILIEREEEYVADIERRIAHVSGGGTALFGGAEADR